MTAGPARVARGALSGAFFAAYGVFALPFALLLPLLPRRTARAAIRLFYRMFVRFARLTRLFRVECDAADSAALASLRGKVVAMNHVSLIDIVVLLASLGDSVCIAKAAAKRNPFLSAVVRTLFISNDAGPERAVEESRAFLARGVNVVVFPEGTRVPADAPEHRLNRGAARLALAAGAGVAAVHISYDPPVLGKRQPWWDVGEREIAVRLSYRGICAADGGSSHRNAVELTERIRERIL